jgi:hypothetical protein
LANRNRRLSLDPQVPELGGVIDETDRLDPSVHDLKDADLHRLTVRIADKTRLMVD